METAKFDGLCYHTLMRVQTFPDWIVTEHTKGFNCNTLRTITQPQRIMFIVHQ